VPAKFACPAERQLRNDLSSSKLVARSAIVAETRAVPKPRPMRAC
jgi:hypothetical protein